MWLGGLKAEVSWFSIFNQFFSGYLSISAAVLRSGGHLMLAWRLSVWRAMTMPWRSTTEAGVPGLHPRLPSYWVPYTGRPAESHDPLHHRCPCRRHGSQDNCSGKGNGLWGTWKSYLWWRIWNVPIFMQRLWMLMHDLFVCFWEAINSE